MRPGGLASLLAGSRSPIQPRSGCQWPVASVSQRKKDPVSILSFPAVHSFFLPDSTPRVGFLSFFPSPPLFLILHQERCTRWDSHRLGYKVRLFRSRRPTGQRTVAPASVAARSSPVNGAPGAFFSSALACAALRMTALQNLPQAWRRLIFLLPVLVITLILATGLYNGSLPKPRL